MMLYVSELSGELPVDLGSGPVIGKCPHFEPRDFNASKHEKEVLCNFRRQCVYCQGRKNKRARCAE